MGEFDAHGSQPLTQDITLRALAHELINPLINIARRAELNDAEAAAWIQESAENTLRLIDSFLLCAQSEYGQNSLDLAPASIGSVMYDASTQLREAALARNADIFIDDRAHDPVMTHRKALTSIVTIFGNILIGSATERERHSVVLRGYRTRGGKLGIGVFGKSGITQEEVRTALQLQGRAHMPLASISDSTHVSLAIADSLCKAIGGSMSVKHMGKLSGLATELPRSEQLAFV